MAEAPGRQASDTGDELCYTAASAMSNDGAPNCGWFTYTSGIVHSLAFQQVLKCDSFGTAGTVLVLKAQQHISFCLQAHQLCMCCHQQPKRCTLPHMSILPHTSMYTIETAAL